MRPTLRRLRLEASQSRGRRYPELSHRYRDEFQRDRDRIVHARAFRRLENKTQVFTTPLSDHFRNRLTHTIEVAQIARTVASVLELNENLTEALALAHDIGHPPFGHAGEEELDRQMRVHGDRFEHNLHALRIVESFEQRYACFPGLNLTFEVREGIVKHSHDFEPGESPIADEYLPELRPPLEAQLIDLADEIAYNTADLDDAHSADLFVMEELLGEVPAYYRLYESVEQQYPGASERIRFFETLRRLIDELASGLIEGTWQAALESGAEGVEGVRRSRRLARFTPETEETNRSLKGFLHRRVYSSPELAEARKRSAALVAEVFGFFLEHPSRLPTFYQEEAASQPRHRVVCDYIAGMTDRYLERIHREMRA